MNHIIAFAAGMCLCMTPSADGTGSVSGRVDSKFVKKFPALVYIDEIPGGKFKPPEAHAKIDQKAKEFVPRALAVLAGTTVDFLNSDDFLHNVFSPDNEKYDLGNWGKGEARSYKFERPGVYVQLCKLHPEMIAYVVALRTPYFAWTDSQGAFKIPEVPAGTHVLKVWNEKFKPKQLDAKFEVRVLEGKDSSTELKP